MSQKPDDLDAVKAIVTTLEPFESEDRERIIRWTIEKLGIKTIPTATVTQIVQSQIPHSVQQAHHPSHHGGSKDIKSFLLEKAPNSANQLVAAVAYYHKFEAPDGQKKPAITAEDVLEACRKANLSRPKHANQIMVNANGYGIVDKVGTGTYEINAVGENLVAVSMPTAGHGNAGNNNAARKKKKVAKKK